MWYPFLLGSLLFDNAGKQANAFVLFHYLHAITFVCNNSSHMLSATRQVLLDSLTYFQLLFPASSSFWKLTRNRLKLLNISNTHSQLFRWHKMWSWTSLLLWECAVNYPLQGDLHLSLLIKHDSFLALTSFQLVYFTLLFAAHLHDSNANLLDG